ncbi:MAG: aldo/keto reductase [Stappiaceae bacterium]
MNYRHLGRTDLRVSNLCLGTMTWGEQNTEAEGHQQMDTAFEAGINFLDAAELYPIPPKSETHGRTEEIIGSWLKKRKKRDDVVLATKVMGRSSNTWLREDGSPGELNRRQIEEAVNKSLRRLGTDYIDLYQVHWPDRNVSQFGSNPTVWADPDPLEGENPIVSTLEVLSDLVHAGKVRHVGISNESAWGVMQYLNAHQALDLPRVQSIQNAYSLLNRTFEVNLAEVTHRENVGLLAYSALAQGYLTGKYRNGALPNGSRKALYNRLQRYEKPGSAEAVEKYRELAGEFDLDMGQMSLSFAASRSFVTSVIIGATTMKQLKSNIAAVDVTMTRELEARINGIQQLHSNPAP